MTRTRERKGGRAWYHHLHVRSCSRIEGRCPKTIAGPHPARIKATCCVPNGVGVGLRRATSAMVESAANVWMVKNATWKSSNRQIAGVRLRVRWEATILDTCFVFWPSWDRTPTKERRCFFTEVVGLAELGGPSVGVDPSGVGGENTGVRSVERDCVFECDCECERERLGSYASSMCGRASSRSVDHESLSPGFEILLCELS